MSTIQELEQVIQRLQREINENRQKMQALLARSEKAMDFALHAYRIDHNAYVWVWDTEAQDYKKTNIHICTPEVEDKSITERKMADDAVSTRTIKDKAVTNPKIGDGAVDTRTIKNKSITEQKYGDKSISNRALMNSIVTPEKMTPEAREYLMPVIRQMDRKYQEMYNELRKLVTSYVNNGIALSDKLGNSEDIGITQKTITNSINQIWKKLADITGETSVGLHVTVTPDYFVNEDSAEVTIKATAGDGIFETLRIYVNDALVVEKENAKAFTEIMDISNTSTIHTVATILGMEYEDTHIVTKFFPFFIGCGEKYEDILTERNVRKYDGDLTGSYDIRVDNEGERIFIVIPASIRNQIRMVTIGGQQVPDITMNGFEIPLEVINTDVYTIYKSLNQYKQGLYNIDIN